MIALVILLAFIGVPMFVTICVVRDRHHMLIKKRGIGEKFGHAADDGDCVYWHGDRRATDLLAKCDRCKERS
jgi:hypothetical protein